MPSDKTSKPLDDSFGLFLHPESIQHWFLDAVNNHKFGSLWVQKQQLDEVGECSQHGLTSRQLTTNVHLDWTNRKQI